ncbi:MAG: Rieske 2Fe-2S domain-containing protein [Gemmatimonas sp.]
MDDSGHSPAPPARRNFLIKTAALLVGGVITVVAPVAGLITFLDPLRRKAGARGLVRVATIGSLPSNGEPKKLPVLDTLVDAWNRTENVPVGSVYIQKTGKATVRVLNAVCPHLGCSVGINAAKNGFACPCHKSSFALDGKIADPKSPSPRGMDELEAEVKANGEIWVKFQNFRKGTANKIPV